MPRTRNRLNTADRAVGGCALVMKRVGCLIDLTDAEWAIDAPSVCTTSTAGTANASSGGWSGGSNASATQSRWSPCRRSYGASFSLHTVVPAGRARLNSCAERDPLTGPSS